MSSRISIFILGILASISLVLIASPAVIIPPSDPVEPVTVYVLDLGLHSSLVLPDNDDKLIRYAYGDWRYFALNQQDLASGVAALLIPTQGTLARRKYENIAQLQQAINNHTTILNFAVARAKATGLQKQNFPGLNELPNQLIEQLAANLTQSAYTTLVKALEYPIGAEITARLTKNFPDALEIELQKKHNLQELEQLLVDMLEEIKINYVKNIAEEGIEKTVEEVENLQRQFRRY